MSAIEYVTLSITRTSFPQGAICRIDYSYYLNRDKLAYRHHDDFTVRCELWGRHLIADEPLGDEVYDVHRVASDETMPVERSFLVPCGLLNEKLGRDEIYIRVIAEQAGGVAVSAKSPVVRDYF
jgi:hypothetical protein